MSAARNNSNNIKLVFGYIRIAESSLDRVTVPMEITLICLSYFYWAHEYFADAHCNYDVVNSENEISIKQKGGGGGSAFGNVLIPSYSGGIYVWRFKILKVDMYMYIGISTEYTYTDEDFYNNESGHNYALDSEGIFTKNGDEVSEIDNGFRNGDIVTMRLDLNKRTLKYKRVGPNECEFKEEGFYNIACGLNIHYKMAVTTHWIENEKIELIGFCYFRYATEFFADAHPDYRIVNSKDEISVKQLGETFDYNGSAFGNVLIPSCSWGIYTWTFKITADMFVHIGISTEYEVLNGDFCHNSKGYHYSFKISGSYYSAINEKMIKMTLDLNKKRLKYVLHKDEHQPSLYKSEGLAIVTNIACGSHIHYKMAVCCCKGDKVQLVDFSINI